MRSVCSPAVSRRFRSPHSSWLVWPALQLTARRSTPTATGADNLVCHRHVDVTAIVEIATAQSPFPLAHAIRDADVRDVVDLTAELRRVKTEPSASGSRRWLSRAAPVGARIPGLFPAMYAVMRRSRRLRQRTGTVAVTAVGMFAGGGGFAIAPLTLMSLQIVIGGVSARPSHWR